MQHVREKYPVSERRACRVLGPSRTSQRYQPIICDDENALTAAIVRLAGQYGRYGYRRVMALLHAEAERRGLPWLTLLRFCEEGNNIPDGQQLAQALVRAGACGTAGAVRWATPSCWALVSGPLRHFVQPF